jgi:sulfur relay (sulfurtransferase) DsrC/TusE family protein
MLTSHLALYRILFWTKNKRLTDDHAKVLSLLEDHFDEYSDTEAGDTLFEYTSAIRNTANPEVALSVVLRLLPAVSSLDAA